MLLCILSLSMVQLFAQMRVTGKVTDAADGSAIPFATVVIKGTATSVPADANGLYVLNNVPENGTLVFSSIGYETQEIPVNGRAELNAVLIQQAVGLEQIMVVAYGITTKGSYSGSATQLRQESFKDVPVLTFEQAIVGAVPGVQISQKSGQPGSLPEIRIRGFMVCLQPVETGAPGTSTRVP